MRSFGSAIIANMTNSRVISARATFRDVHLNFNQVSINDGSVYTNGQFFDVSAYGTGFLRIAVVYNPADWKRYLYYQYVSNPNGSWPAWVNTAIELKPYSRPAVVGGRVFYHQSTGTARYADFNGTTLTGFTDYFSAGSVPTAFAPVSSTDLYVQYQLGFFGDLNGNNTGVIRHRPVGQSYNLNYQTCVYGPNQFLSCFDAVRLNGTDYIFFSDNDVHRAYYVTCQNEIFSEAKPVIPLDVVEDDSYFYLGGVTVINNKLFITGVLKRDVGAAMHVYLYGVDHLGLGRDMYIATGETETKSIEGGVFEFQMPPGKLVQVGNDIWYVGPNMAYKASGTMLTGYDNPAKKLTTQTISQFQLNMQSNQSYTLNTVLGSSVSPTLVKTGNSVDLEVSYANQWGQIGKFDISSVSNNTKQTGKDFKFTAYSYAMKRIAQWSPDSSYDYWSQTKQSVNPIDEAMIRGSGYWKSVNVDGVDSAALSNLNIDGYLYSIENPARGMIARARFYCPSDSIFRAEWGIVVNFYKESYEEVAVRLGDTEPQDGDYRNNGIIVTTDGTKFMFNLLSDDVRMSIHSDIAYSIPKDTWHWIQVEFHEGTIRVLYRNDASTNWTEITKFYYSNSQMRPWKRDGVGRAAMYVRNITPNSTTYGFYSSDTLIPVQDSSVFPTSETVIVDDEIIEYNGKTGGTPQTNLTYIVGEVVATNPSTGSVTQNFANAPASSFIRQQISVSNDGYANGARVYVKKVGAPTDNLIVSLYVPSSKSSKQPIGTRVASGTIYSDDITTSFGWIVAKFDTPVKLDPSKTYYLTLTRENNPDNPDTSNYYATSLDNANPYGLPFEVYDSGTKTWTAVSNSNMPFTFYALPLSSDDAYQIAVTNISLPSSEYQYNDMALVAISGRGTGYVFRVNGFIDIANGGVFMVDSDPAWKIGKDTVFALTPSLKIAQRGSESATHGPGVVSVYRDLSVYSDRFEYFSADKDMTLTDMIAEIAGKAGVEVVPEKYLNSRITLSRGNWDIPTDIANYSRPYYNAIFDVAYTSGEVGILLGYNHTTLYFGYIVSIKSDGVRRYKLDMNTGAPALQEFLPYTIPSGAKVRMSVHETFASVWVNGFLAASFFSPNLHSVIGPVFNGTVDVTIDWNEIDDFIDNYILDMGTTGDQLLSNLVQERRVFYQDDQNGNLRIFRNRATIPGTYQLSAMTGYSTIDSNTPTRVRVVGTDTLERNDDQRLKDYGNVFRLFYYERLDDKMILGAEADRLIADAKRATTDVTISGAFDPRVEPNDILTLPSKSIIAEEITASLLVGEDSAVLDMEIGGYENI